MTPSLLDRFRMALGAIRGKFPANRYEGAVFSPARSILSAGYQSMRFDASSSTRSELARKARWFERNSAFVNRVCDLFETYTVGPGIQFFAGSSDAAWNTRADSYYSGWKPFADISSRQSWDTLQGLIARGLVIDGEVFILLIKGESNPRGGNFPRVQLIEGHLCQTPSERKADEGKSIVDGVEIDGRGRPIGYWFVDEMRSTRNNPVFVYKAAENVIHCFEPSRPGQYRGISMLHPVINDLHDLDDMQLFEMRAAKEASEISNIYELGGPPPSDVADAIAAGGAVPVTDAGGKKVRYEEATPGRTVILDNGDKLTQWRSDRPSIVTRDYWASIEEKAGAGIGISRQLIYAASLQGTVARSVLDMAAAWFRVRSGVQAEFYSRVWQYVIEYGTLTVPRLADPPGDWRQATWRPPQAINVDVGRNSQAMLQELAAGTRTLQDIYAEKGRDWRVETRQRAIEVAYIRDLAAEFQIAPESISSSALPSAQSVDVPTLDASDDAEGQPATNAFTE